MVFKGSNSKKGNVVLETITIILVLIFFAVTSIFGYQMFDELNTDIQADTTMGNESKEISGNLHGKYANLFDNLILMAFVLLFAGVLISTFMLDSNPLFFVLSLVAMISLFVVAAILGNTYESIMMGGDISVYANQFTYTTWLMTHILELAIGSAFAIAFTLFAKNKLFT